MSASENISAQTLRDLLRYDPETGELFWRARPPEMFPLADQGRLCAAWNARFADKPALTHLTEKRYLDGAILGIHCKAHRAIWCMVHSEWPDQIDHIDGDTTNNRLVNLRAVSNAENKRNTRRPRNNKTGVIGVIERNGRYVARIKVDGRTRFLGSFDTIDAAKAARRRAEKDFGFHPNHGREMVAPIGARTIQNSGPSDGGIAGARGYGGSRFIHSSGDPASRFGRGDV